MIHSMVEGSTFHSIFQNGAYLAAHRGCDRIRRRSTGRFVLVALTLVDFVDDGNFVSKCRWRRKWRKRRKSWELKTLHNPVHEQPHRQGTQVRDSCDGLSKSGVVKPDRYATGHGCAIPVPGDFRTDARCLPSAAIMKKDSYLSRPYYAHTNAPDATAESELKTPQIKST